MRKMTKKVKELSGLNQKELVSTSGGYAPPAGNSSVEVENPFQDWNDILKWW